MKIRQEIIEAPSGYELNPKKGWFNVIVPSAKTNECTNPSFETNTTGWAITGGAAMARVTTYQRRGIYSLQVTPVAGVTSGVVYSSFPVTANVTRSVSIDFLGIPGIQYEFLLFDTVAAVQRTLTRFYATGHWERLTLTYAPITANAHRIYIRQIANANIRPFYVDGCQIELGNPTTYLDGDMVGFVLGQNDYRWNGTAHASSSWRSGQTRSGGEVINFKTLGLSIIAFIGLGMAPVENISTPLAKGGEFYQDTIYNAREFSILGVLENPDLKDVQKTKENLEIAFTPDATVIKQPLIIRYIPYDCGEQIGDPVDIQCSYMSGLEGNVDNLFQEKIALTFKQYLPLIKKDGDSAIALGFQSTIANTSSLMQRNNETGVWSVVSTNWLGGIPLAVRRFSNGDLLIIGSFTTINGVTYNGVARWDGTSLQQYVVGPNIGVTPGSTIFDAVIMPNDNFIITGNFALAGGVANTARIARWTGATWSPYGTGLNSDGYCVALYTDGYPIVGGLFTLANGVLVNYVAKWTGATFAAYGTGLDSYALDVIVSKAGVVWVGGNFATANGVTVNGITYWTGTTFAALGTGLAGGLAARASSIVELNNGDIVIGGFFATANGLTCNEIVTWTGSAFVNRYGVGVGVIPFAWVNSLFYSSDDNILYISGAWTSFNGLVTNSDFIKVISPTSALPTLIPIDIVITLAPSQVFEVFVDPITKNITVPFDFTGLGTTATYPTSTANNLTETMVYPKVKITGPGTIYSLENNTTKQGLYFSGLTLFAGEIVTIDFNPENTTLISSSRGDISGYLLPASNLDWFLQPGTNYITFFMYGGTTAATSAFMMWSDGLLSLDGAVW